MTSPKLVVATKNQHKLQEISQILTALIPGLDLADIKSAADFELDDPVEDAPDFAGNAILKAQYIATNLGVPALADDSGLCVDILGGAPGIFSARWSGMHGNDEANLDLLLAQLKDVPEAYRTAAFRCVTALVTPAGDICTALGEVTGVLRSVRAGEGGFGYDPIFQPAGYMCTMAELSAQEKNKISHRAIAVQKIAPQVAKILGK